MDRPAPNQVHGQATPYLGGLAVVGSLTVTIALLAMLAAFLRTPALERLRAGRP